MTGGAGDALLLLLAIGGGLALAERLLRAAGRLLLVLADATALRGMAEVAARRGDVTGVEERSSAADALRRDRAVEVGLLLFWLATLVLPPVLGITPGAYAVAAFLWICPRRRSHRVRRALDRSRE